MKKIVRMICNAFQERLNPLYKCVLFINLTYIMKVKKSMLPDDRKMLFHTFLKTFLLSRN